MTVGELIKELKKVPKESIVTVDTPKDFFYVNNILTGTHNNVILKSDYRAQ